MGLDSGLWKSKRTVPIEALAWSFALLPEMDQVFDRFGLLPRSIASNEDHTLAGSHLRPGIFPAKNLLFFWKRAKSSKNELSFSDLLKEFVVAIFFPCATVAVGEIT